MRQPATLDARLRAQRFLRKALDDALIDAPDDVEGPTDRIMDGQNHPLTRRFCAAIAGKGYQLGSHNAGSRRIDGIRRRLELEDLVDTVVLALGHRGLFGIRENDQARSEFVRQLYEFMHSKRAVLIRRRDLPLESRRTMFRG